MKPEKLTAEGLMVNMAYTAAFASERMILEVERILKGRGDGLKHEKKQAFTRLAETLRAAKRYYDFIFDEDLVKAAERRGDMADYDRAHEDENEIARLLLLYADRCGPSQENYEELFRVLRNMPDGLGLITEDVLKNFYMKRR